jgi:hypothetical protein
MLIIVVFKINTLEFSGISLLILATNLSKIPK